MKNEKAVIYKLSSGEEVIGKFVNSTDTSIQIRSPMKLINTFDNEGTSIYLIMEWVTAQFEVREERIASFNRNLIISQSIPSPNIEQIYLARINYLINVEYEDDNEDDSDGGMSWPNVPKPDLIN